MKTSRNAASKAAVLALDDAEIKGAVRIYKKYLNRVSESAKGLKAALATAKKEGRVSAKEAQSIERTLTHPSKG